MSPLNFRLYLQEAKRPEKEQKPKQFCSLLSRSSAHTVNGTNRQLHLYPDMFFPRQLTLLASLGLWIFRATAEKTGYIPLNITALSSRNGYSVLECWQLASIPVDAMAAANYAIGETTVATWSRIEPRTTVGEAWAPKVQ